MMTLLNDLMALAERVANVESIRPVVERHELEINGERGLSAAINDLADEVRSLRKGMYWVAGLIVAGSIGFAFSVMALI